MVAYRRNETIANLDGARARAWRLGRGPPFDPDAATGIAIAVRWLRQRLAVPNSIEVDRSDFVYDAHLARRARDARACDLDSRLSATRPSDAAFQCESYWTEISPNPGLTTPSLVSMTTRSQVSCFGLKLMSAGTLPESSSGPNVIAGDPSENSRWPLVTWSSHARS